LILVDTNVILDLVENDPVWADWSQQQLESASLQATLCINPVIYAELSIAFDAIEELESMLIQGEIHLEPIPREALFLAGKTFVSYRRKKGRKTGYYLISSSVLMQRSRDCRCSRETRAATRLTSRLSSSLLRRALNDPGWNRSRAELTAAAAAFRQMGTQFWLDKAEAALEAQH